MSQPISSSVNHPPVRVIAIAGCDGSGKSTLTQSLFNRLSAELPVEMIYLGQSSGRIGEWICSLPLIGRTFGHYLLKKADTVNEHPTRPPGAVTALVIYLLSCWRCWKFRKMLNKSQAGRLMITDRYPQVEVAGFRFDGPQLAKTTGGSWWVQYLRKHEQRLYAWMASYPPMLLIRLDIDAETAHARKPDHKLSALREKVAVIPGLTFNGAKILDLDGRVPADKIIDESLHAIRAVLA